MTRDEMRKKIVKALYCPDISYGTADAAADRILALMPDPALAEIGRLAVEAERAWSASKLATAHSLGRRRERLVAAYLTSETPK